MTTPVHRPRVGFVCAYTPLVLIDAAGFAPYRILPVGDWPDQAGQVLHDNLCPHVKRILDRAQAGDLPPLAGMIFTNSCDAMRRAADAWQRSRPQDSLFFVDLPSTGDETAVSFLADEFGRLANRLRQWTGAALGPQCFEASMEAYNDVAAMLKKLDRRSREQRLKGGRARLQVLYNLAATQGLEATRDDLRAAIEEPASRSSDPDRVPVYLFGNVLADPQVFSLLESCGADVVGDDFCTGSRMFTPIEIGNSSDIHTDLARCVLSQPPCPRTMDCARPGKMAADILAQAKNCSARGVIGHTLKFCDPYLNRLPHVRNVLREEGLAILLLEGDCSLRSIGQQRTRIEAFIEMLR